MPAPKRARAAAKGKPAARKATARKPALALAERKKPAARVVKQLKRDFPEVECALEYETPFHLLVATILSAQCTDERVNQVTPGLFKKYPDPAAFAAAPLASIEKAVQSTGFFRNKAKNIQACSRALIEEHDGEVPQTLDELTALAGVGRKTANVVLGTAFGLPTGVVVDTHVQRLSQRLGLTEYADAVKIERDLMELVPQDEWIGFSHRLIFHGRQVCKARKPACAGCSMKSFCPKIGVAG
ncbi:MAG: endonuclease III [Pirellulales bacterium]|nr:endonuclease III [Pirellulales bacterium]